MVASTFFNNFQRSTEQELLEDLVIESVKIYGQECYYMPRRRNSFDDIYYEDDQSSFDTAYFFEIYVKNVDGFGQATFLSKFGLEIRDQAVFSIARRTFAVEVTREEPEILRPREGDLIFFPLNGKSFQITFVDNKPFFYQLGELQMYDVTVELYEYSNETFETGIPAIDALQLEASFNVFDYAILSDNNEMILSEDGLYIAGEEMDPTIEATDPGQDNVSIDEEIEEDDVINWSESNPFAEGRY